MHDNEQEPAKDATPPVTRESVLAALKTEERFVRYLDQFDNWSRERFMEEYATYKVMWWQSGPHCIERNEQDDMQWISAAERHLEIIQQKKLFDAQCLWRAEQVTFPEVTLSFDFEVWSHSVLYCPFLDPVTEEEVDLYIQYLGQDDVDLDRDPFLEWQDYEGMREALMDEESDRDFPGWYAFHNSRTGAGSLLQLPDIRGEKEGFYRRLAIDHDREANKEKYEERERNRDKRPTISFYDEEQLEQFIRTLEDRDTLDYYRAYRRRHQQEEREELRDALDLLLTSDEPVPIEAHEDFRVALDLAVEKFRMKKIAEFLPFVFEEYGMRRTMGQKAPKRHLKAMKQYGQIRQIYYDQVIKGRVLNGEPGDLAF